MCVRLKNTSQNKLLSYLLFYYFSNIHIPFKTILEYFVRSVCDFYWNCIKYVELTGENISCVWLFVTPVDCIPPGSIAYGIFRASILERVATSCSRGPSRPRGLPYVFCLSSTNRPSLPLHHAGGESMASLGFLNCLLWRRGTASCVQVTMAFVTCAVFRWILYILGHFGSWENCSFVAVMNGILNLKQSVVFFFF